MLDIGVALGQVSTQSSILNLSDTARGRINTIYIVIIFVAFFLIFLGLGLIMMKNLLIMGLFPVLPGLWVYYNLREDWDEYQQAKQQQSAARSPGSAGGHTEPRTGNPK